MSVMFIVLVFNLINSPKLLIVCLTVSSVGAEESWWQQVRLRASIYGRLFLSIFISVNRTPIMQINSAPLLIFDEKVICMVHSCVQAKSVCHHIIFVCFHIVGITVANVDLRADEIFWV